MTIRQLFLIVSLLAMAITSCAQDGKICCTCVGADHKLFGSTQPVGADCSIACASNQGVWKPGAATSGACRITSPEAGERLSDDDFFIVNAEWSMGHEGAIVWSGGENDNLLPPKEIRRRIADKQTNGDFRYALNTHDPANVQELTRVAIDRCLRDYNVEWHFKYVCGIDSARKAIKTDSAHNRFNEVRSTLHYWASGHPQEQNGGACLSGEQIKRLTLEYCK